MDEQFLNEAIHSICSISEFGNLINETMFMPLNELLLPSRKSRARGLPRPQNCFVLYRRNLLSKIKSEGNNIELKYFSKFAAMRWNSEERNIRQLFMALYEIASVLHQFRYPKYRYKPRRKQQRLPLRKQQNVSQLIIL